MTDQLLQLAWVFFGLGLMTIGGSDAVLAEMQRQVVAHGWMSATEFSDAYVVARLAPGPGGLVSIPVGYRAAGLLGALAATVAFIGPSLIIALIALRRWGAIRLHPWAAAFRNAVTPISVGLTAATAWMMGASVIHDWRGLLIAAVVTLLCTRAVVPVVLLPIIAGASGYLLFI